MLDSTLILIHTFYFLLFVTFYFNGANAIFSLFLSLSHTICHWISSMKLEPDCKRNLNGCNSLLSADTGPNEYQQQNTSCVYVRSHFLYYLILNNYAVYWKFTVTNWILFFFRRFFRFHVVEFEFQEHCIRFLFFFGISKSKKNNRKNREK